MKMRRMRATGSLGFLIGIIASNCGGGVTSGGRAAPLNDAGAAGPDGLVSGFTDDGAVSDTGGPSLAPAPGGQVASTEGGASDTGGPSRAPASDGQVANGDGSGASDTGGSNDASASDANSAGNCPSSGASDGGQPVPQVFASVSLGAYYDPNHGQQNICGSFRSLKELFSIGTATGTCDPEAGVCNGAGPVRVRNCDSQSGGATVNVSCSVTGGYDVYLQASLGAIGALTIAGHVDPSSGGNMLTGDITYQGNDYQGFRNCTVTYTYGGMPIPQNPPVAPGRIWAHLSCPQMGDPNGVRHVKLMDMSLVPEECDGEVDFLFENCTQ